MAENIHAPDCQEDQGFFLGALPLPRPELNAIGSVPKRGWFCPARDDPEERNHISSFPSRREPDRLALAPGLCTKPAKFCPVFGDAKSPARPRKSRAVRTGLAKSTLASFLHVMGCFGKSQRAGVTVNVAILP